MRELADVWTFVADTSCRGYSPLYDRICRTVATSDDVLGLIRRAPPEGHFPVLMLAVVHYLVLGGVDHPLASVYAGESNADPGPLFVDFVLGHRDEVLDLLATRHVNTNEVGRSAVLGPAMTTVSRRSGQPLAHLDVGCSAGLNLLADRYRLDYGPAGATGPVDAPVRIQCTVLGGDPPIAPLLPPVAARVGLDLDPVDLDDADQVRWQLACAWPDTGRLERTRLAIAEARQTPRTIVEGDAVADVGAALDRLPRDAAATVTTTWALAYLPREERPKFAAALAEASRERPIYWISAEGRRVVELIPGDTPPSDESGVEASVLGLTTFRDGDPHAELLGYVHPHGSSLDWRLT